MDFKKFGTFVFFLGMLTILYSGFQWITNQPVTFDRANSKIGILGGRDDFANYFDVQDKNQTRKYNREKANKIMLYGGITAFLGIGLALSAKNEGQRSETSSETIDHNSTISSTPTTASRKSDKQKIARICKLVLIPAGSTLVTILFLYFALKLPWWLDLIAGLIVSVLSFVFTRIKIGNKEEETIKDQI